MEHNLRYGWNNKGIYEDYVQLTMLFGACIREMIENARM